MAKEQELNIIGIDEINNNFFTLKEVAETYNRSYANVSRKAKKLKLVDHSTMLRLGNRFIVHKDDIKILIQDERQASDEGQGYD